MAATEVIEVIEGGLGDMNIGLAAAVGFINPLGAQLDAMIAANAQFRAELALQLDASLALQASLSLGLEFGIEAALQAAIDAMIALQAALSIQISFAAELGISLALSAALSAKLAALVSIEAAIAIKIPAILAAANLGASLSVGGIVALSFDGLSDDPPNTLADVGQMIKDKFAAGIGNTAAPPTDYYIAPTKRVSGVIIVTDLAPSFDAIASIMVVV